MDRRIWFAVISLLVGVIACQGSISAPAGTSKPENSATGVTEAKAIAVTPTAGIPPVTSPPLETFTGTPALTQTPGPTSTPLAPVFGEVYGIQVLRVEKTANYFYSDNNNFPHVISPSAGNTFLEVDVVFYKQGVPLWEPNERLGLSVTDSGKNVYQLDNRDITIVGVDLGNGNVVVKDYVIYFSVPITASGFKLQYRNLPLINLGP